MLTRAAMELSEPSYWNPVSLFDYAAVWLTSLAGFAVAIALVLWWRVTEVRRGAFLLPIAAVILLLNAIGNVLEDAFRLQIGADLYNIGGDAGPIAFMAAAILALSVAHPQRWSGAFLLGYVVGFMFPDNGGGFFSAVALLGMSYWLIRQKTRDETLQPA